MARWHGVIVARSVLVIFTGDNIRSDLSVARINCFFLPLIEAPVVFWFS